jgi:hypothetical protein
MPAKAAATKAPAAGAADGLFFDCFLYFKNFV